MAPIKAKFLRPIRANQGLKFRYQKQMLALIDEMRNSVEFWIEAQYKKAPPLLAQDASPSPSKKMQSRFKRIAKQWKNRFEEAAPKIAEAYLKGQFKATDSAMRMALRDAGIAVKFKMTPAMRDAFNASLTENVGLIRSIPEEYLQQVEGIVARSYATGRDLQTMVKRLKRLYPTAANRAVLIARDQSNKANAVTEQARRLELGIQKAMWLHSHGGKVPRPEHVKAGQERRIFDVAKGCPIPNEKGVIEYILPGEKINCRCVSRSILTGLKIAV
ncbi:MAG: phage minor head protein [Candidatus Sulfotelmatobacter sp.]